jgi:ABC-2 type transport system ATP-binding protein/ribosome-dependent ATPase
VNVVRVRHATMRFDSFTAVDRVDLDVEAGEIVGLLGANGAGKTTLIKMLLGLLLPTEGTVRLFGERASLEQRRRIGYVPQNLGLYTDLTASENLEFRAEVFGIDPTPEPAAGGAARSMLVAAMPLGRQRIVAFEAATQHDPGLLVLDEPTSGVSPLARSHLWDLIHERAESGVGVLVSTHYMDEAEQADRLLVMSRGRVVATGRVADVIGDRTAVAVSTERWADAFEVLDRPGRILRLAGRTIRVIGEAPGDVAVVLERAGLVASVSAVPATLEEVLIETDAATAAGRP